MNAVANPRLAIISATYNEQSRLEDWRRYYDLVAAEIELHVIVDNSSDLAYSENLKAAFPDSFILRSPVYRGHISANNIGFSYALAAGAELIGVLLPDFRVPYGTISRLCECLRGDVTLAGIAPIVLKAGSEDQIEYAGCLLDTQRVAFVAVNPGELRWMPSWEGITQTETMHGGMYILKRSTLESIGVLNEKLFMYCDEMDFGWRAKIAGLRFGVLRSARVWHEHKNYGKIVRPAYVPYLISRNRMLIMNKYGNRSSQLYLTTARLANLVPSMLNHYRGERTIWHSLAYAWGLWDGIRNITGAPPAFLMKAKS